MDTSIKLSDHIATIGVVGIGVFITIFTGTIWYSLILFASIIYYSSYTKSSESSSTTASETTATKVIDDKKKQFQTSKSLPATPTTTAQTNTSSTPSTPTNKSTTPVKSTPSVPSPVTSPQAGTTPTNKPLRQVPSPPVPPRPNVVVGAELSPPPVPPRKQIADEQEDNSPPPPPPRRASATPLVATPLVGLSSPSQQSTPNKVLLKTPPQTPSTPSSNQQDQVASPYKSPQSSKITTTPPPSPSVTTPTPASESSESSPTKYGNTKTGISTLRGIIGGALKNITGQPQLSKEEIEKNNLKRKNIAEEILQTEKVYVGKLKVIVEVFYIPLKTAATANPHPPLTSEQVHTIFSEIVTIYNYNSHFFNSLQDRIKSSSGSSNVVLGDVFISITDFLKSYTVYINNYSKSMETLEKAKKNQAFAALLDEFSQNPVCDSLGLESLLIMPVQRIPRYILLLTELSKVTDKSSSDYSTLSKALDKMKVLASDMNENRREAELLNRMYEIQRTLDGFNDGDFMSPARKLIAEANFEERSMRSSPKLRDSISKSSSVHYILCNDILLRTKQKGKKLHLKEVISVNSIAFKDVNDEPLAIVSSEGDTLLLKSESEDQTEEKWKDLIKTQQKINKDNEISFGVKRDSLHL